MLKRVLGFLLRFFFRSFTKVMGCVVACLRIREDRRIHTSHFISDSSPSSTDVAISQNCLSSLLSDEREDSARNDGVRYQEYEQGLKDEAEFLKACGTIPGTPAEIRKASEKLKVSPSSDKYSNTSIFHTSVKKLQLVVQPFDPPTPIKVRQEWENSTDSSENTPSSCISNAQDTQDDSVDYMEENRSVNLHTADRIERNAVSPWLATDTQRKNKSVRFQCDTDLTSRGSSPDDWHMKKSKPSNNQSAYKPSPYPTPLKLFDEMQTPGTVYPASLDDLLNGKGQIRSQFVYPTNNPGENVLRCKIVEEKDFSPEEDSSELSDSVKQAENATPIHFFPKWWDGNGIPNTTTKYKEDQRVKWHATPFEERLDRALCEENFVSQRKLVRGKPVAFDEVEESDTAPSQLLI